MNPAYKLLVNSTSILLKNESCMLQYLDPFNLFLTWSACNLHWKFSIFGLVCALLFTNKDKTPWTHFCFQSVIASTWNPRLAEMNPLPPFLLLFLWNPCIATVFCFLFNLKLSNYVTYNFSRHQFLSWFLCEYQMIITHELFPAKQKQTECIWTNLHKISQNLPLCITSSVVLSCSIFF